jgi:recombination associated protein RdgC
MTEDFLAVVETKRFLGQEFLTWLVHRIEEGAAPADAELALGDRVVLADAAGDRLTVAGAGDTRAEVGAGLRRGKLLDRARLVIARGERRWELSLDGGLLVYAGLRCPKLGPRDAGAHADRRAAFENDLFLRLADVEEALAILDGLFAEFCRLRGSAAWAARELPRLRAWVERLG